MKTRSINELLILLSKQGNLFKKEKIGTGLCWLISQLCADGIISDTEAGKLKKYIKKECPNTCKEYLYSENQIVPFYFPRGRWAPRLRWIKEHIK